MESSQAADLPVYRNSLDVTSAASVDYTVEPNTASSDLDYTPVHGTLLFAAGEAKGATFTYTAPLDGSSQAAVAEPTNGGFRDNRSAGSIVKAPKRALQCRWDAVTRPVAPTRPISWPR